MPRSRPFTSSISFGGNDHSRPTTRPTVAFMGLKLRVGGAGDKRDRRLVDCRFHARSPSVAAALARAEGPPRSAPLRPQPRARQPARPLHIRPRRPRPRRDRKSTRLNSSHTVISYAVFCLKKKKKKDNKNRVRENIKYGTNTYDTRDAEY